MRLSNQTQLCPVTAFCWLYIYFLEEMETAKLEANTWESLGRIQKVKNKLVLQSRVNELSLMFLLGHVDTSATFFSN